MFLRIKRSHTQTKKRDHLVAQEISSPHRINEILRSIFSKQATLVATIPGDSSRYSTTLLDLFPDQRRLALDELKPAEGHANFLRSKELELSCSIDGLLINFRTELKEKGEVEGITFYRVLFPTTITYLQRRQHPRVTVPGSAGFHACHENSQRHFNGYVHDISASGIAVFLDGVHTIKEGERLIGCTAQLPLVGTITFDLEACYIFHDPMRNIVKVGGSFIEVDRETERKLEKLIKHLQGEEGGG
ncbi:MAG: flagellar brake protein [Candidatus Polarisedimenticolaceae bacterium]|nr:flagellar brake protein [Candidatus Polarisedimenticolaceae bacterium]